MAGASVVLLLVDEGEVVVSAQAARIKMKRVKRVIKVTRLILIVLSNRSVYSAKKPAIPSSARCDSRALTSVFCQSRVSGSGRSTISTRR